MARSKQKASPKHLLTALLLATVSASHPSSRRRVDPAFVQFAKTLAPQNGAVKQYSSTDWTKSRRDKWYIVLKHKANRQSTNWGANKTHLRRLSDNKPYETFKEAEREVFAHQMTLEGFVRGEGVDSKEFFESPAMVSAREKADAKAKETSFAQSLDEAAAANDGRSHAHTTRTHTRPTL